MSLVNTQCTCVQAPNTVCPVHHPGQWGIAQMQQRPVDRLARELAFAVCEWLASDGDDDKFAVVDRLADAWRAAVIDD